VKNIINILLRKLYNQIPKEVLELALNPSEYNRTLDALVKEEIIVGIVLVDCNLYAGRPTKITLKETMLKTIDEESDYSIVGDHSIYYIPPEFRENRDITVVLDMAYPAILSLPNAYPYNQVYGRSVLNAADDALSSMTHQPMYMTPEPILMGNNTIALNPPMTRHVDWILSCMLSYDKDFTNVSSNLIKPLEKMVIYGAQVFIYNKLRIKVQQGFLEGGAQLEPIKEIVESYSDAQEKFDEAFKKFRGASVFEKQTLVDLLSLCIGS